jgi:UDP-glucose 4-epimerase
MKVVVTGATGNVGTSVVRSLKKEPSVDSIVGIARRIPETSFPKTRWEAADVAKSDLVPLFAGADAVIHLAWAIQPSRDLLKVRETNVLGSQRVAEAVREAKVPALLYASSVGAYSPGPKDRAVDERWPVNGVSTSFYSRHKAEVEKLLDGFEQATPGVRVVRLRKAFIFKSEAATGMRRLFIGPFLPAGLVKPGIIPIVPDLKGLRFQCVHSYDVGEAYRLALTSDVRGAFNIAADPVLDLKSVARIMRARPVPVPVPKMFARAAADLSWRLRLQPSPPGWFDLAIESPIMATSKAMDELGWYPSLSSIDAFQDLIQGLSRNGGVRTPPLDPRTSGPFRIKELGTGMGGR